MNEYPKIETLYDRDPKTFKVIPGKLRCAEFGVVARWLVTEKIDGTNVRITLAPDGTVTYGGRTANAQMPTFLMTRLSELFPAEKVTAAFEPGTQAVLYGEGYGPKIQSGGVYCTAPNFRLFDVAVQDNERTWWLRWPDVEDVAAKLGISTAPVILHSATLDEAVACTELASHVARNEKGDANVKAEGIVARTEPMLFMRNGDRVVWKLKRKDFLR